MNRHLNEKIIQGYHGVMELDLRNVAPEYHDILIKEHKKDIELYKIEQSKLPSKLRYENNVGYVKKKLEMENKMREQAPYEQNRHEQKKDTIRRLYDMIRNHPSS